MQRITLLAGLITLWLTASLAHASGFVVPDEPMIPPRHAPHARLSPLELRHHHVEVMINDQIAVTEVEQTFFNPSRRTIEGVYYFPVPRDGSIDRFTMFMDGEKLEAELLPADEAKRIYESIVRRMKDPGLLEYIGQDLVRIRIFPIEPNSERRVRLQFTQLLQQDHDIVTYNYPLHSHRHVTARQGQLALKATLTTSHPIQTVYSPTHEIDLDQPTLTNAVIGFEVSIEREDDFSLLFATKPKDDDIGLTVLSYRDPVKGADEDGYFLLLASPSAKFVQEQEKDQIAAKDVILVLDTSGSMSRGKLEQAKNALHFILDNLNSGDRFEIIRFSTDVEAVFDKLVPADKEHRQRAAAFVDGLRPRGMTAIDDALRKAVTMAREAHQSDRPSVVIFLTDGLPTIGVRDPAEIVSNVSAEISEKTIRIFCFGIGADVNTHLLDHIAQNTRAASQYVLADEDLEMKLSGFYAKISDPVLTNVTLSIGDGDSHVRLNRTYPADLPDLFAGDQLVLFGRYRGHGDVAIRLSGVVDGEKRTFETTATFTQGASSHEFVPRLWAVRRIGFLLDQVRLHGESEEARDEITRLAREYGIVTPYTSYLIIEDEMNRDVPLARRSVQVPLRRDPGSPSAPEPEVAEAEMELLASQYRDLRERQTGDEAVRVAQAADQMRQARNIDSIEQANVYGMRGAQLGIAGVPGRTLQMQQARLVRGRAFFQNGDVWVDSNAQALSEAELIEIEFGSDAYFDLLAQHPDAAAWFALGRNVQLVLGETIYDIREPVERN